MLGTKNKIVINSIFGSVIWESSKETVKEALEDANLKGAYLEGAYLKGANLKGANLEGAYLEGANLEDANLEGANLKGANLKGAYLKGANLKGANLKGAYLKGAYLKGAYLEGAYLEGANLKGAYLEGANLKGANLEDAYLEGANLKGANLRGAKNAPQSYVNLCSRDILFILESLKSEVPFLRKALVEGHVNGTQYEGECACLIGTLAKADGGLRKVCSAIPFYDRGLHNPGEQWFWNIRTGDTPENSEFVKQAVLLCDMVVPPTPEKGKAGRPRKTV